MDDYFPSDTASLGLVDISQASLVFQDPQIQPSPDLTSLGLLDDMFLGDSTAPYGMPQVALSSIKSPAPGSLPDPSLMLPPPKPVVIGTSTNPAKSRKPKGKTLREADWEPMRARIRELILIEKKTLRQVIARVELEFDGFTATERQYKSILSKWNIGKKVRRAEMRAIVRKQQHRKVAEPEKPDLVFELRNEVVPTAKIKRFMKKEGIAEDAPYSPSSGAATPVGQDFACLTPGRISPAGARPSRSDIFLGPRPSRSSTPWRPPPSPALSISSVDLSTSSHFQGQSPRPHYQSLTKNPFAPLSDPATSEPRSQFLVPYEMQMRYLLSHLETQYGRDGIEILETLRQLASVLNTQGRYKSAEELARRSALLSYRHNGADHPATASCLVILGEVLFAQGRIEESEKFFQRCKRSIRGTPSTTLVKCLCSLGSISMINKQYKEAEQLMRDALAIQLVLSGPDDPKTTWCQYAIAGALHRQQRWAEAEELATVTLDNQKRLFGLECRGTLQSMTELVLLYRNTNRLKESERLGLQTIQVQRGYLGAEHPDTMVTLHSVALTIGRQGRFEEALGMMKECHRLRTRILGPTHHETINSLTAISSWETVMLSRRVGGTYT